MASCPNCKASVPWDAAECSACQANFEAHDGWHPKPQDARETRLLRERTSRQRQQVPVPAVGEESYGLKFLLSFILLLITLSGLLGTARLTDRFWPTVTCVISAALLFLVWVPVVYRLLLALAAACMSAGMIYLGLRESALADYLWAGGGLAVVGAVSWLAESIPDARQATWFKILGASLIAGAFGLIGGTNAGFLLCGLALAVALGTRAWIYCTGRRAPRNLGWAADMTAAVPGEDWAPRPRVREDR